MLRISLAVLVIAAILLQQSQGAFVHAPAGGSCSSVCASASLAPANLQQFNKANPVTSSACAANVTGQIVTGYQLTSNTTCTVATGSSVTYAQDFSCLCLDASAEMGIVAAESNTCQQACQQRVNGLVGTAVQPVPSNSSAACIPSEDLGQLNRFGNTQLLEGNSQLCYAAFDGHAYATASFSCFCVFEQGSILLPPAESPVVANPVATGGR